MGGGRFDGWKRPKEDPRTTVEIFRQAMLVTHEDGAYWKCVRALQWRGTREVFHAAASLVFHPDAPKRRLGIDTIAQLGVPERSFPEEAERVLLGVYELESDPEVLECLAFALSWTGGDASCDSLVALSRHTDRDVRYAATHGLGAQDGNAALTRLIELTQDPEALIRDWATFSLGYSDCDTPELRDVFLRRTRDEDMDVRGEAMRALASRKDYRVLEPLLAELEGEAGWIAIDAAAELGDPRLYPALERLVVRCDHDPEELERALEACRPDGE